MSGFFGDITFKIEIRAADDAIMAVMMAMAVPANHPVIVLSVWPIFSVNFDSRFFSSAFVAK